MVKTVGYSYANDHLTAITMPSGHRITYGYTNDRITSVSVDGSPVLRYVRYHPMNVISGWTWFNGTVMSREYDLDGRIIAIASNGESSYRYYPDDRLKSWTEVDAPFEPANAATTLTLDSYSNQIASTVDTVSRSYAYDAIGNVVSDGVRSFGYNNAGRLVTVNRGGRCTDDSSRG